MRLAPIGEGKDLESIDPFESNGAGRIQATKSSDGGDVQVPKSKSKGAFGIYHHGSPVVLIRVGASCTEDLSQCAENTTNHLCSFQPFMFVFYCAPQLIGNWWLLAQ